MIKEGWKNTFSSKVDVFLCLSHTDEEAEYMERPV